MERQHQLPHLGQIQGDDQFMKCVSWFCSLHFRCKGLPFYISHSALIAICTSPTNLEGAETQNMNELQQSKDAAFHCQSYSGDYQLPRCPDSIFLSARLSFDLRTLPALLHKGKGKVKYVMYAYA